MRRIWAGKGYDVLVGGHMTIMVSKKDYSAAVRTWLDSIPCGECERELSWPCKKDCEWDEWHERKPVTEGMVRQSPSSPGDHP
jgi:hypothetical protein